MLTDLNLLLTCKHPRDAEKSEKLLQRLDIVTSPDRFRDLCAVKA